jgi:hypothetical protein
MVEGNVMVRLVCWVVTDGRRRLARMCVEAHLGRNMMAKGLAIEEFQVDGNASIAFCGNMR